MAKETENFSSYNIISAGTTIKGEFNTNGNVRIDGTFEGSITTKGRLIVGQSGRIIGTVVCQNAELEGTLNATVEVEQHLAIKSAAKLIGDVKADKVSIEVGAIFHGRCEMNITKEETPSFTAEKV